MKAFFGFVLIASIGLAHSFDCPEDYCKSVNCSTAPTQDSCPSPSTFKLASSRCNCCATCTVPARLGTYCDQETSQPTKFVVHKCQNLALCIGGRCFPLL